MARIIFISPYMKGGRDSARLAHRTRYFATREGVQLLKDDNAHLPATKKQQQYIHRLLRSFPEARELPEHENYANTPNRQTAFELIAQIHEDFIEPMDSRENYLDYVANRPGVKAMGEHGLWDANGKVSSLENAVAEVAQHTGNVWTPVISLSRENAERLGYTDLKNWQELINASITDIAKGYKIHPNHLRWYAALHEKEKHIHVHMVIFSTDPKEGFLTKQGIRSIKSALVSTIYRNDRLHIYEQKDEQRSFLQQEAEARMVALIEQMATGTLQSNQLELLVADLAQRLQDVSGKKVYGYLPPRVKRIVDEIVDELAKDERVSSAYYGLRRSEVLGLRWSAIDMEHKTISISHKVIEAEVDGKFVPMGEDVLKTKSSFRTLPLIPAVGIILLEEKEKQEMYRRLFKKSYCRDYLDYICVDQCGKLLRPNYVTEHFSWLIEKYGLRKVRFHDLRHTCASLLLSNGISMKQIQIWLGHSTFSTTADIYAHLDYSAQEASANAMNGMFNRPEKEEQLA